MAQKLKQMTKIYGAGPYIAGRKMMVRYMNQDWDYDVVSYIDKKIIGLGTCHTGITRDDAIKMLKYWKYLFLVAKGEEKEGFSYLKKAYADKSPDAIAQYAYFFYTGQKITRRPNTKKALKLFERALEEQSMFAEYLYAEALIHNNEDDLEIIKEVIPYYETAIKKGVVFARYNLARCYYLTKQNLDKAKTLLEKSDDPRAKQLLETVKVDRYFDRKKRK